MKNLLVLALVVAAAATTVACEGKKDNKRSAPVSEQENPELQKSADQKLEGAMDPAAAGTTETMLDQKSAEDQAIAPVAANNQTSEEGTVIQKADGEIVLCATTATTSKAVIADKSKLLKAEDCKSNVIESEVIVNTQPTKTM
jgi:hypothetical protein